VLDVKAAVLYLGTLGEVSRSCFILREADVHFCGDSQSTRELYLLEARKTGVRPNRRTVYVMREEVVSISRLDDVVLY
jgi:hypothetical protein